jgi:hypothetical protein
LKQVEEIERKAKLHVDNICRVVDEKTIVNKPVAPAVSSAATGSSSSSTSDPAVELTAPKSEEEEFEDYVEKHEKEVMGYAELSKLTESEQFLLDNLEVLNEHACGWLLLHMLSLEMAGERKLMLNATRQYLMLRNILDLAREIKRGNDARQMVKLFFKQISTESDRVAMLDRETQNFGEQIIMRAEQKKLEEQ